MWRTTVHAHGVKVDGPRWSSIDRQLRDAFSGSPRRIVHVHVRLYGDVGGSGLHTCYIRVDFVPSGGIALGDTAVELEGAVARAIARIGVAIGGEVERGHSAGSRTAATSGHAFLGRSGPSRGTAEPRTLRSCSGRFAIEHRIRRIPG